MKSVALVATLFVATAVLGETQRIDLKQLKCLVCRTIMDELEEDLSKINPDIQIEVGGYRLDAHGNAVQKKVPMARSQIHISDMLEGICSKMENYVRATYKSTGRLTILNIMSKNGGMNPEMSKVDIIQDSDLNKSLGFYCEGIVEEWEEAIVDLASKGEKRMDTKICRDVAQLCADSGPEDEEEETGEQDEESEYSNLNLNDEL